MASNSGEFRKELVSVLIDGESISQDVYVDNQTGLDVDPHSGVFRSRQDTISHMKEVYAVGKDSMRGELERYNRWMQGKGKGAGDPLMPKGGPVLKRVNTPGAVSSGATTAAKGADLPAMDAKCSEWKDAANKYFGEGKYRHALMLYGRVEEVLGALLLSYPPPPPPPLAASSSSPSSSAAAAGTITIGGVSSSTMGGRGGKGGKGLLVTGGMSTSALSRLGCASTNEVLLRFAAAADNTDNKSVPSVSDFLPYPVGQQQQGGANKAARGPPPPRMSTLVRQANTPARRAFLAVCLSNSAEAYLRLALPLEAYRCAVVAMRLDEANMKARYRAAMGALGAGAALRGAIKAAAAAATAEQQKASRLTIGEALRAETNHLLLGKAADPPSSSPYGATNALVVTPLQWFEEGLSLITEGTAMMGHGTPQAIIDQFGETESMLIAAAEGEEGGAGEGDAADACTAGDTFDYTPFFDKFGYF